MNKPDLQPSGYIPKLTVQPYESYNPSAFNDSLSILQKLNKLIYQMNALGAISNNLVTQWNELIEWILGNGLNEIVSEEIDKRIKDGTFDDLFDNILGNLDLLTTQDKTTIVAAINEVNKITLENKDNIGDMSILATDDKDNLVNAINEIKRQTIMNLLAPMMIAEATGHGIINGFKVTQQPVLSMAVDVGNSKELNIIHMKNGDRYELPSVSIPVDNSHGTLSRKDIVFVSKSGVVSILKGIESLNPVTPTMPEGGELLAEIIIVPLDTTINNVDITDKRELKALTFLDTENQSNLVQAINEVVLNLNKMGEDLSDKIGELANLPTTDKTSIVNSIIELDTFVKETEVYMLQTFSEVFKTIGNMNLLITPAKADLVSAINSVYQESQVDIENLRDEINRVLDGYATKLYVDDKIGDLDNLPTDDKTTLVNAIIEVVNESATKKDVGDITLLPTTIKTNIVASIIELFDKTVNDKKELNDKIGDLSKLETTNKTNIVSAINEIVADAVGKIGNLDDLKTSYRQNIVGSINEVYDTMQTEIAGGISELVINVKSFGAKGDGVTDDSAAIKAAIDSIPKGSWGGGTIYFPHGRYAISETINITQTSVIMKGFSPSSSRIIPLKDNLDLIKLNQAHRFKLQDIMLDGVGKKNIRALTMFGTAGVEVNNIWIDSVDIGVYTNDVYFATFNTIRIFGSRQGYFLTNASNVFTLINCYSLTLEGALTWYSSSTLSVQGCSFEGFGKVVIYNVQGFEITGCYWEGMHPPAARAYNFLQIGNATGGLAQGGSITGNFFLAYASFAMVVYGAKGVNIAGNYMSTDEGGIVLSGEQLSTKNNIQLGGNIFHKFNGEPDEKNLVIFGGVGDNLANDTTDYRVQQMRFPKQPEPPTVALKNEDVTFWWNGANLMCKFKDAGGFASTRTIAFKEDTP